MRNCQSERFLSIERVAGLPEGYLQGATLRTFDIKLGSADVHAVQVTPQQGTRSEDFPPAATYVGQPDQSLIPFTVFPVVWNHGEDIWRDPIDEGESVPRRSNQAEDLQCITFESVDLEEHNTISLYASTDRLYFPLASPQSRSKSSRSYTIAFQYFSN